MPQLVTVDLEGDDGLIASRTYEANANDQWDRAIRDGFMPTSVYRAVMFGDDRIATCPYCQTRYRDHVPANCDNCGGPVTIPARDRIPIPRHGQTNRLTR